MPNCLAYALGTEINSAIKANLRSNREWRNYILNTYDPPLSSVNTKKKVTDFVNGKLCDNDEIGKALLTIVTSRNYNTNFIGSTNVDVLQHPNQHAFSIINTIRNTGKSIPPFQIANYTPFSINTPFPDPTTDLDIIFVATYAGPMPESNHYFTNKGTGYLGEWAGIPSQSDTQPNPVVNITSGNRNGSQSYTDGTSENFTIRGWFS